MKEELRKSLTDLIDETLLELEELKKSRFAPAEIEIKGPGENLAGKPTNGDLHAKKAEDEKEEDEKDEEAEKAEGHNHQSNPDGDHHKMDKADDKDEDDEKKKKDKDEKGSEEHEKEERKPSDKLANLASIKKSEDAAADEQKLMGELKKSKEETETLLKSFVEERVKPLEDKLSTILDIVNRIADQPVPPKGVTARAVPLMKSAEEGAESLSKAEVATKLLELKKSGTKVDSLDITRAEMGHDLSKIIDKYKIS